MVHKYLELRRRSERGLLGAASFAVACVVKSVAANAGIAVRGEGACTLRAGLVTRKTLLG